MKKSNLLNTILPVLVLAAGLGVSTGAGAQSPDGVPRGNGPVVYVTGQDMYYDTIVLSALPPKGPFQKLEMDGPTGLQTEFGLGDLGYVGGRWWVDGNGNGQMDGVRDGDSYFLCPLLGPGREAP